MRGDTVDRLACATVDMDFSCLMATMQAAAKKKKPSAASKKGRDMTESEPTVLTSIENVLVPLLSSLLIFLLTSVERLVDELFYKHLEAIHRIVDGLPPDVLAQAQSSGKGECASDSDNDDGDEDGAIFGEDCGADDHSGDVIVGVSDPRAGKRLSGSQRASRGGKTAAAAANDRQGSVQSSPSRKRTSHTTQSSVPTTSTGRGQAKSTSSRAALPQSTTMSPLSPPPTPPAPASRKRVRMELEKPVAIKSQPPHHSPGVRVPSPSFSEDSRRRDAAVPPAKNEDYRSFQHMMGEEASQSLIPELDM